MSIFALGSLTPILLSGKYSTESTRKIFKAVELLGKDDEEALRILDTIGTRSNPSYGHEILSAAVFYYKGIAAYNLGRDKDAKFYLDIVDNIPSWYVVFGRSTLKDIKEEARKLKFKI